VVIERRICTAEISRVAKSTSRACECGRGYRGWLNAKLSDLNKRGAYVKTFPTRDFFFVLLVSTPLAVPTS
jgi:hypothetical protein